MRFVTRLSLYVWYLLLVAAEVFGGDAASTTLPQVPASATEPPAATAAGGSPQPRPAPDEPSDALKQYIAKPDPSYHWTKRREGALGKGTYVELMLTSQTWRDIVWKHQLYIYKPSQLKPGPVDG